MMKRRPLFLIGEITLIAIVALFNLGVGIYHLTHGGPRSGITEIALFGVLAIAAFLAILVYRKT